MKREAEIRALFVENAIHLIAKGGFEMATTKELTHYRGHLPDIKMNEVYIYRLFGNKESIYVAAFQCLDLELYEGFKSAISSVGGFESDTKKRLYEFFILAWQFLLRNEERCRCYVRYYYSIYFKGVSLMSHRRQFMAMVQEFAPIFKEEADVPAILHSVFSALLDFAIRVYNGDIEDNKVNREHIFNVLYCMMMTYFKEPYGEN